MKGRTRFLCYNADTLPTQKRIYAYYYVKKNMEFTGEPEFYKTVQINIFRTISKGTEDQEYQPNGHIIIAHKGFANTKRQTCFRSLSYAELVQRRWGKVSNGRYVGMLYRMKAFTRDR